MPSSPPNEIATRGSCKVLPLPDIRADLGFGESYTADDFERIKRGVTPQEMEDKWFVFYEEPWLYFHRSWTGACIYAVRFRSSHSGVAAVESWVTRDPDHYKETRTDYDRALLKFLIDAFLLGRQAAFPVPSDVPASAPAGVYQHNLVGRAYPETTHPTSEPHAGSFWKRFLRWFRRR